VVGKDDPAAQTKQIYKNLQIALASVGASLQHLVKTTTYVVSRDCIDAVREARAKYLADDPPTSTLLVVSRLSWPEFLLEIEAVAYVG
jgi:enamine deaminase RidA (YjgF/YER057c/UK114 family)